MRAVKDSPATPLSEKGDGAENEKEDPRWTRAVGDHTSPPSRKTMKECGLDARSEGQPRPLPIKSKSDSAAFELPYHALLREPLGFCNLFGSHAPCDIVSIFLGLLLLVTLHVYCCEAHPQIRPHIVLRYA